MQTMIAIVHDVRSAHNVGSIFRTADAAGVSKIYLTGYTPAPLDRFIPIIVHVHSTPLFFRTGCPVGNVVENGLSKPKKRV